MDRDGCLSVADKAITDMDKRYGKRANDMVEECRRWLTDSEAAVILLVTSIVSLIPATPTSHSRILTTTKYHALRHVVDCFGLTARSYQYLLQELLSEVLNKAAEVMPTNEEREDVIVTDDTRDSLYYIGGFFLRKLCKRFLSRSEKILELLESWAVVSASQSSSSTNWTCSQNRGGLRLISEEFYNILLCMEVSCHIVLMRIPKTSINLRDLLFETILQCDNVKSKWCLSSSNLNATQSDVLLSALSWNFAGLRSQAYAKSLNDKAAYSKPKAQKRSASLRDALRDKSNFA